MGSERRGVWSPSLRRRFMRWFGLVFIAGAILFRVMNHQASVDAVERDLDIQLWARLGAVKAQERLAPDARLGPHLHAAGPFLPDAPRAAAWGPHWLGFGVPRIDPGEFHWFAGVWRRDGTPLDAIDLPPGFAWNPQWADRLDTIWTTADGTLRLAASAGAHDTLLVVGTPLEPLAVATRRAAAFQLLTFAIWVPLVLAFGWLLLSFVLVPLESIAAMASRIRAGSFAERIDVAQVDAEFHEVGRTVNEMLDRLDAIRKTQSQFNADVAHQLLNPVHSILLEADAATADMGADRALRHERIAGLAHRIEEICEGLLAYSRSAALDARRLGPIDVEPIVAAAIDRVGPAAASRGIAIQPPSRGAVVKGDATLLEELFVNLLANAVEHSPAGGSVEVSIAADPTASLVAVIDHGPGVAAADLPHLFERFRSGRPEGGHGVGLALARVIARGHGGDVAYAATPGGGATFTARFPTAA
ncbi:MAG: ATP-binding protein [Planctomycetota bacterium]